MSIWDSILFWRRNKRRPSSAQPTSSRPSSSSHAAVDVSSPLHPVNQVIHVDAAPVYSVSSEPYVPHSPEPVHNVHHDSPIHSHADGGYHNTHHEPAGHSYSDHGSSYHDSGGYSSSDSGGGGCDGGGGGGGGD